MKTVPIEKQTVYSSSFTNEFYITHLKHRSLPFEQYAPQLALREDVVLRAQRGHDVGRGAVLVGVVRHVLLAVRQRARHVRQRLVADVLVLQLPELSEHLRRKLALAHEVQMFCGYVFVIVKL